MVSHASAPSDTVAPEDDLVTEREARAIAGGKSRPVDFKTLRSWVASGFWPAPIQMGPRTVRYSRAECLAAIEARKAARKPTAQPI